MNLSRRELLKIGVCSAAALALTQVLNQRVHAVAAQAGSLDLKHFANRDAEVIAALAPVILDGALPIDADARRIAINEVVEAFDRAVAGLSPAVQGEVAELMSLLTLGLTRRWIVGIDRPWSEATTVEIQTFLRNWRNSRFAVLQQVYQALVRLMLACWYGNPLSWSLIGYGGPPHARELGLL